MKTTTPLALITSAFTAGTILAEITSPIVDTGQEHCYDGRTAIRHPDPGEPFHGQDGQYAGNPPSYRDNGDGTENLTLRSDTPLSNEPRQFIRLKVIQN